MFELPIVIAVAAAIAFIIVISDVVIQVDKSS
jgi:hypothetical protein